MCKKCANPDSPEGKKVRDYLKSIGKNYSEDYILRKSKKLIPLDEPSVYTNPGFTPDVDSMPDRVHAKPRHMWVKIILARRQKRAEDDIEAERYAKKLLNQYRQLKIDPKPEFFEWAASQPKTRFLIFQSMLRNAISAKNSAEQTKASSGILEYSKAKPKQAIEISQPVQAGEISELFRQLASLGGIPAEAVEQFIGSYIGKPDRPN